MSLLRDDPYLRLRALAGEDDVLAAGAEAAPLTPEERAYTQRSVINARRSEADRAFQQGLDNIRASGVAMRGLVRSTYDEEAAMRDFQRSQDIQQDAAEFGPRVQSLEDIGGVGDALAWGRNVALTQLPNIALSAGSGGTAGVARAGAGALARGVATRRLARTASANAAQRAGQQIVPRESMDRAQRLARRQVGGDLQGEFTRGAAIGGAAAGTMLQSSMAPGIVLDEDPDNTATFGERAGTAAVGALVTGSLEALPVMALFRKYGLAGAEQAVTGNVITRVGKQFARQGATEAMTEVAQTAGERIAHRYVNENIAVIGPETYSDYLNAAAGGFIGGGIFGAPSGLRGVGVDSEAGKRYANSFREYMGRFKRTPGEGGTALRPGDPMPPPGDSGSGGATFTDGIARRAAEFGEKVADAARAAPGAARAGASKIKTKLGEVQEQFQQNLKDVQKGDDVEGSIAEYLGSQPFNLLDRDGNLKLRRTETGAEAIGLGPAMDLVDKSVLQTVRANGYPDHIAVTAAMIPIEERRRELRDSGALEEAGRALMGVDPDTLDDDKITAFQDALGPAGDPRRTAFNRTAHMSWALMRDNKLDGVDLPAEAVGRGNNAQAAQGDASLTDIGEDSAELGTDGDDTTGDDARSGLSYQDQQASETLRNPGARLREPPKMTTLVSKPIPRGTPQNTLIFTDAKGTRRGVSGAQVLREIARARADAESEAGTGAKPTDAMLIEQFIADAALQGYTIEPDSVRPLSAGKTLLLTPRRAAMMREALSNPRANRADPGAFTLRQQTPSGQRRVPDQSAMNEDYGSPDVVMGVGVETETSRDETERGSGSALGPRTGSPLGMRASGGSAPGLTAAERQRAAAFDRGEGARAELDREERYLFELGRAATEGDERVTDAMVAEQRAVVARLRAETPAPAHPAPPRGKRRTYAPAPETAPETGAIRIQEAQAEDAEIDTAMAKAERKQFPIEDSGFADLDRQLARLTGRKDMPRMDFDEKRALVADILNNGRPNVRRAENDKRKRVALSRGERAELLDAAARYGEALYQNALRKWQKNKTKKNYAALQKAREAAERGARTPTPSETRSAEMTRELEPMRDDIESRRTTSEAVDRAIELAFPDDARRARDTDPIDTGSARSQATTQSRAPANPANEDVEQSAPVNVWAGTGENAQLSNLYPRRFTYEGRQYVSVEHAYQTLKSGEFDAETYGKYDGRSPRKIAGTRRAKTADGWNIQLMRRLIDASFEQNPRAAERLLATGDAPITHTQDRGVWREEFPKALMATRARLRTPDEDVEQSATGVDMMRAMRAELRGPYVGKDAAKARKATAFIGDGAPDSSTRRYNQIAARLGLLKTRFTADDRVFVSVNGARPGRIPAVKGSKLTPAFEALDAAIAAGATIITDTAPDRARSFNVGEREIADYLQANGYVADRTGGQWAPAVRPNPANEDVEQSATAAALAERLNKDGIPASHASPIIHEGKFNWREHIGRGEGNAAFGAGTNLSTANGVHRSYKNMFTAQIKQTAHAPLRARVTQLQSAVRAAGREAISIRADISHTRERVRAARYSVQRLQREVEEMRALAAERGVPVEDVGVYEPNIFDDFDESLMGAPIVRGDVSAAVWADAATSDVLQQRAADYEADRAAMEARLETLPAEHEAAVAKEAELRAELEAAEAALSEARNNAPEVRAPSYHVVIHATPDEIFDWDTPLSEQPKGVQEKLAPLLQDVKVRPLYLHEFGPGGGELYAASGIAGDYDFGRRVNGNFSVSYLAHGAPHSEKIGEYDTLEAAEAAANAHNIAQEPTPRTLEWDTDDGTLVAVGAGDLEYRIWELDSGLYSLERDGLSTELGGSPQELQKRAQEIESARVDLTTRTGREIYTHLASELGSQRAASDRLQELGFVGHRYASSGGRDYRFPNYIIYNDVERIETLDIEFDLAALRDASGFVSAIDQVVEMRSRHGLRALQNRLAQSKLPDSTKAKLHTKIDEAYDALLRATGAAARREYSEAKARTQTAAHFEAVRAALAPGPAAEADLMPGAKTTPREAPRTVRDALSAVREHATPAQRRVIDTLVSSGAVDRVGFELTALPMQASHRVGVVTGGHITLRSDTKAVDTNVRLSASRTARGPSLDIIQTLIHEAIHAATGAAERGSPARRRALAQLLQHAREHADRLGVDPDSLYGLAETQEFIAQAFSDPDFQNLLRQLPARNTDLFQSLWDEFKDFVRELIGLPAKDVNLLDEVFAVGLDMMKDTAERREAHYRELFGHETVEASAAGAAMGGNPPPGGPTGMAATPAGGARPSDYFAFMSPDNRRYFEAMFRRGDVFRRVKAALPEAMHDQLHSVDEGPALLVNTGVAMAMAGQLDLKAGPVRELFDIISRVVQVPTKAAYGRAMMMELKSRGRVTKRALRTMDAREMTLTAPALAATRFVNARIAPVVRSFATDMNQRMRTTGVPALTQLATLISQRTGEFRADRQSAYAGRAMAERNKRLNEFYGIVNKWSDDKKRFVGEALREGYTDNLQMVVDGETVDVTADVARVRKFYAGMRDYLVETGVLAANQKIEDYFPVEIDPEAIVANRAAFIQLFSAPNIVEEARRRDIEILTRMRDNARSAARRAAFDSRISEITAMTPAEVAESWYAFASSRRGATTAAGVTFADGDHDPQFRPQNQRLMDFIYKVGTAEQKATFATFQDQDFERVTVRYVARATKRGEWSRLDLGGQIERLMAAAEEQGATPKQIAMARGFIDQTMGTYGTDWHPAIARIANGFGVSLPPFEKFQSLQQGLVTYQNLRLLPLALMSSIIDPLGVSVRSGGEVGAAFKSYRDAVRAMRDAGGNDALRALAEDMGVIERHAVSEALIYMYGAAADPGTLSTRINAALFRFNGLEYVTKFSRLAALSQGQRFLMKHAAGEGDSARYLRELNLTPADVVVRNGKLVRSPKIDAALSQFVDESVVRPTPQQRPGWHNDPHFQLAAQYKGYLYSFWNTIARRGGVELSNGNPAVLLPLVMYVPIQAMGEVARDAFQGDDEDREWQDYAWLGVERSGLLGPKANIVISAQQDLSYRSSVMNSVIGPTGQQLSQAYDALQGQRSFGRTAHEALPFSALHEDWL